MKFYYVFFVLIILSSCSRDTDIVDNSDCTYTPTLYTEEVSNISEKSAVLSGQIKSPTCESTVTSQGFVYSKTTLPKTDDFVIEVNGENISSELTDLERNSKYYVRTFFVNPTGEYYGNQVEFMTKIGEINITTKDIKNITYESAQSGGIIIDDGGGTIINKGVCWSTSPDPTINDYLLEDSSENNEFNSELTGLLEDTTYYLRSFATNESGTTYGNEKIFKTSKRTYKVDLEIKGSTDNCGIQEGYLEYEITYRFDDNDIISEKAEGTGGTFVHSQEGLFLNNLEVTIHLGQFKPENPSDDYKGAYLNDISIVIINLGTNEKVLDTSLPRLFICTDVAYKNIINFNPVNRSYDIEWFTYGF
jgi:hypothetical protein